MTDLLHPDKCARDYIRMSEIANCRLSISHAMIGSEQRTKRFSSVAMRMGTALEPMIIQYLADEGMECYFTGDEQLEMAAQDPYRVGHSDGIVTIPQEPSYWMRHNLPAQALEILTGGLMLLEVKTMAEEYFDEFKIHGLRGGVFIKKYISQINEYIGALLNAQNDELWAGPITGTPASYSGDYHALLRYGGWTRPTHALVVAFSPARKQFAFEVRKFDPDAYIQRSAELNEMIALLHNGKLPDPDYDGQAADCYFCPYAYTCPAVQATVAQRAIDTIPVVVQEDKEKLDELATRYYELSTEIKALSDTKAALRNELGKLVPVGSILLTDNYVIELSETKGRRTIDRLALEDILGEEGIPHKTGKASTRLRIRPLFGPSTETQG